MSWRRPPWEIGENGEMSETQVLSTQFTALRQRLQQKVKMGAREDALFDMSLRRLAGSGAPVNLPRQLTGAARHLLERGRELLRRLRELGNAATREPDEANPRVEWYLATLALVGSALRTIAAFPNDPGEQLRLCEGIAGALDHIDQRIWRLADMMCRLHREKSWVDVLAEGLTRLSQGKPIDNIPITKLAKAIAADADDGVALRFLSVSPQDPARFIAAHSLNVAQVMARCIRLGPAWSGDPPDPLLAALLHDVGMLSIPAEILADQGPLNDAQRRVIERHCHQGVEWIAQSMPNARWLAETAADHHERLDGTGYPSGIRADQIAPLTRMLAVCDTYAALRAPRPHRDALDPRAALADTLMLADEEALDRAAAERLLELTFYPTGTIVELADGCVALVVATPAKTDVINSSVRSVVAVLTNSQARPLPLPQCVDLSQREGQSIVRSLTAAERQQILGTHFPEYA
jgi:HD-GYP domain-containing protein (c-di-GMP phosphodiesterase class II)